MIKMFKFAAAVIALTASTATAGGAPWKTRAPSGMTSVHQQYAAQARQVQKSLAPAMFGFNPLQANWNYKGDRLPTTPLSNMSIQQLNAAITGRYFVHRSVYTSRFAKNDWSVMYFAKDGKTHFCRPSGSAKYKEYVSNRYVATSAFGLAGTMHWDGNGYRPEAAPESERVGWPTVANSATGEFAMYAWGRGDWYTESGWLQDDYAAAWARYCPNLPRAGSVNNAQQGRKLSEIAKGARAFRGFKTAFQNDPRNPLTAGMYYHLYNPTR